jgi:hypothetical protein
MPELNKWLHIDGGHVRSILCLWFTVVSDTVKGNGVKQNFVDV